MRVTLPAGTLVAAVAAALGATASTAAVLPHDNATAALERAAFVALPAVYEVRGDIQIDAIDTGARRISVNRRIPFRGTAFGVAPGRVVTALHLISPPVGLVLDELRALGVRLPAATPKTRLLAQPVTTVTLTRARSASECLEGAPTPIPADVVETTDVNGDLALLEIADTGAPTLDLDDGQTAQTPVAAIGFGDQGGATPAIRLGTVSATAAIGQDDRFAILDVAVVRGDSGGPVVDVDGRSHGVVLRRATDQVRPVMAQAKSIRELLADDNITAAGPSGATRDFRDAMTAFWAREYAVAERRLGALEERFTDTALIRCERTRAATLATSPYAISGPSRLRGAILALGAMAAIAAAILGILRVRRQPLE